MDQADQYYHKALMISIESKDPHSQASAYHQLGVVSQKREQWQQAEKYYQNALQIKIKFSDLYSQSLTYHQLGTVAHAQGQWQQARDFFLRDLEITSNFDDEDGLVTTLRNLARLRQDSGDSSLSAAIASLLKTTPEKIETLLSTLLSDD